MRGKRKILALLLALSMVLTFMPTMAFATTGEARIVGGDDYLYLSEAINAAQEGDTVQLLRDVSTAATVSGKTMTLDLNGYNIKCNGYPLHVQNGAKLTITNSNKNYPENSVEHNAVIDPRSNKDGTGSIYIVGDGTEVRIEAGYYFGFNGNKTAIHVYNGAKMTFVDGVVNTAGPIDGQTYPNGKEGKIFYAGLSQENSASVPNEKNGTIIVEGGTFNGRMSNSNWGNYVIKGGSFDRDQIVIYDNPVDDSGNPTGVSTNTNTTKSIADAGWIADGYKVVKDGDRYKVVFDQELADAKSDAITALDSVDQSKYSEPELSKVKKAIEDAIAAINGAKTVDEVNNAKSAADEIIKAQKTDAQKTADKAAADLATAKKNAIDALNKVNLKSYIEPERSKVRAAIDSAKKKINAATSIAAVNKAKAAADKTIKAQAKYNSKLPKPTARFASGYKGYLRARWYKLSKKKRSKISGFEVQYSTDKNFRNYKIARAHKTNSVKTVYKVPRKKRFWVRSRVYTVNKNGVKTVGAWSKVRTLRTK